ncbi:ribosomal protein L21 [Anaeramoeba flamelloides]|uniref:Ribosomal protein L21 n=1 Tax=Anaeramoeba flamelloides TaxID=1746091 RepID=A0ABQ8ZDX0_9EUKA|nr:ribosomal protein L21 [Anaeramoeba flamelloides]
MPNSKGYRAGTRHKYRRGFRQHGMPGLSTYLRTFKLGEYVDIIANSAIQKGLPYKVFHGTTGRVWAVTPRAIGVEVLKTVKHRRFRKKLYVRIEHVRKSKCRDDFLKRVRKNQFLVQKAKKEKKKPQVPKRWPKQPREGEFVKFKKEQVKMLRPVKFELDF